MFCLRLRYTEMQPDKDETRWARTTVDAPGRKLAGIFKLAWWEYSRHITCHPAGVSNQSWLSRLANRWHSHRSQATGIASESGLRRHYFLFSLAAQARLKGWLWEALAQLPDIHLTAGSTRRWSATQRAPSEAAQLGFGQSSFLELFTSCSGAGQEPPQYATALSRTDNNRSDKTEFIWEHPRCRSPFIKSLLQCFQAHWQI